LELLDLRLRFPLRVNRHVELPLQLAALPLQMPNHVVAPSRARSLLLLVVLLLLLLQVETVLLLLLLVVVHRLVLVLKRLGCPTAAAATTPQTSIVGCSKFRVSLLLLLLLLVGTARAIATSEGALHSIALLSARLLLLLLLLRLLRRLLRVWVLV